MKTGVLTRQDSDIDGFVLQESISAVLQVNNAKRASVEICGASPIGKDDFGFNVDGLPAFRQKAKGAVISAVTCMTFPVHVVVNLAHRSSECRERWNGRVGQAIKPGYAS